MRRALISRSPRPFAAVAILAAFACAPRAQAALSEASYDLAAVLREAGIEAKAVARSFVVAAPAGAWRQGLQGMDMSAGALLRMTPASERGYKGLRLAVTGDGTVAKVTGERCAGPRWTQCEALAVKALPGQNQFDVDGVTYALKLVKRACPNPTCVVTVPGWALMGASAGGVDRVGHFPALLAVLDAKDRVVLADLDGRNLFLTWHRGQGSWARLGGLTEVQWLDAGVLALRFAHGALLWNVAQDQALVFTDDGQMSRPLSWQDLAYGESASWESIRTADPDKLPEPPPALGKFLALTGDAVVWENYALRMRRGWPAGELRYHGLGLVHASVSGKGRTQAVSVDGKARRGQLWRFDRMLGAFQAVRSFPLARAADGSAAPPLALNDDIYALSGADLRWLDPAAKSYLNAAARDEGQEMSLAGNGDVLAKRTAADGACRLLWLEPVPGQGRFFVDTGFVGRCAATVGHTYFGAEKIISYLQGSTLRVGVVTPSP